MSHTLRTNTNTLESSFNGLVDGTGGRALDESHISLINQPPVETTLARIINLGYVTYLRIRCVNNSIGGGCARTFEEAIHAGSGRMLEKAEHCKMLARIPSVR